MEICISDKVHITSKESIMYYQINNHCLHSVLMKYAVFYLSFMFKQDVIIQICSIEDLKFKALKECS